MHHSLIGMVARDTLIGHERIVPEPEVAVARVPASGSPTGNGFGRPLRSRAIRAATVPECSLMSAPGWVLGREWGVGSPARTAVCDCCGTK